MRPVAIIQHQDFVPPGSVAATLQGAGVEHFVVDATRATVWPSVSDLGGLVILGGVEVLQFHQDTFDLPEGATLLATSPATGLPQAFRYRSRAYGLQFHPEVDAAIVRGWCGRIDTNTLAEHWGCPDEGRHLEDVDKLRSQADAGSEFLARFIDLAELRPRDHPGDPVVDAVGASGIGG